MADFQLPTSDFDFSTVHMARALELAERGRGHVEPNPMVGCIIVAESGEVVGEGYHTRYGAPHAEVEALRSAGRRAAGATLFVTLEPCCHFGKTPPCTDAIISAGVKQVIAAMADPFPQVAGHGLQALQTAGVEVAVGLLEAEALALNAPYLKLLAAGRPWVIAKWAMTLDGKLATHTGDSKWISGEASREIAHQLRGRVDAILVGRGTIEADDPLLTARPSGARIATRVVLDSSAALSLNSQLVQTAADAPVLIVVDERAPQENCRRLQEAGCEIYVASGNESTMRLKTLLAELGRRRMTNVLVEGGGKVLGSFFDAQMIDEAHVFIAPRLIGGGQARSPIAGQGVDSIAAGGKIVDPCVKVIAGDVYIHGRTGGVT